MVAEVEFLAILGKLQFGIRPRLLGGRGFSGSARRNSARLKFQQGAVLLALLGGLECRPGRRKPSSRLAYSN